MHRVVVTQLLKHGAAIMSRKERNSTSYSGTFEVGLRLCLGLFAMIRSIGTTTSWKLGGPEAGCWERFNYNFCHEMCGHICICNA